MYGVNEPMVPKNIKSLQSRSRQLHARFKDKNTILVESASEDDASHEVKVYFEPDGVVHARCNCEWAQHSGVACTHVMAALEFLAAYKNRRLSFWGNEDEARRQKHRVFFLKGNTDNSGVWITSRAG